MSTIKGIFEPFADYVKDQLRVRKAILANPSTHQGISNIESLQEGIPVENAAEFVQKEQHFQSSGDFNLGSRFPEAFYAYTVEKQAIIRMMSGVDLRTDLDENFLKEEAADPDLKYLKVGPSNLLIMSSFNASIVANGL